MSLCLTPSHHHTLTHILHPFASRHHTLTHILYPFASRHHTLMCTLHPSASHHHTLTPMCIPIPLPHVITPSHPHVYPSSFSHITLCISHPPSLSVTQPSNFFPGTLRSRRHSMRRSFGDWRASQQHNKCCKMTLWTPSGRLTSAQQYETPMKHLSDSIQFYMDPNTFHAHILYRFHVVPRTFHTYSIPSKFHTHSIHISCKFHVHHLCNPYTFHVYPLHIPLNSIQNPKINVYRVCVLILPFIWIGSVWNLYGSAPAGWCESSDFRLSCIVSSRKNKFTIRISNDSFQCLVKHLQVSITY